MSGGTLPCTSVVTGTSGAGAWGGALSGGRVDGSVSARTAGLSIARSTMAAAAHVIGILGMERCS